LKGEGLGGYQERRQGCQWTVPKREGRVRALLLRVRFQNAFLYGKMGLQGYLCQADALGEPGSKHKRWLTVTGPSTSPLPCVTALSGQARGTKRVTFCKPLDQQDRRTASEAESWGQDEKRGSQPRSERPRQKPLPGSSSKAEGLNNPSSPTGL